MAHYSGIDEDLRLADIILARGRAKGDGKGAVIAIDDTAAAHQLLERLVAHIRRLRVEHQHLHDTIAAAADKMVEIKKAHQNGVRPPDDDEDGGMG